MTATEYRTALSALGLNQSSAARLLGVGLRTSQHWATGDRSVPEPAARFLRYLIAVGARPEDVLALLG